jgi:hypothetical protein
MVQQQFKIKYTKKPSKPQNKAPAPAQVKPVSTRKPPKPVGPKG